MRLAIASLVSIAALAAACAAVASNVVPQPQTERLTDRTPALPSQAGDAYYRAAAAAIDARIETRGIKPAKNVILFVGDGMGISTITAARIYAGQSLGVDGESYQLAMDSLPWSALSKTYSHDFQVSDSAATATAMVSGLKTRSRFLGVTSEVNYGNCASVAGREADTLFEFAAQNGLATGLVSTARLTHATPASAFAKVPDRNWESDAVMRGAYSDTCRDIARQFIESPIDFDIALGGGRAQFLTETDPDPEYLAQTGDRQDGRNLVNEWTAKSDQHQFVYDQAGFEAINFASDVRVLGLFEPSHMKYELDRAGDTAGEPSIEDMTRAAITRLSQNEEGFVLMVEGGRIDHAHHGVSAIRALEDTLAFDAAIAAALEMTDTADTLIIVTADHSHTLTISGYPERGNPILGLVSAGPEAGLMMGADGKPYTTLAYANGQSACRPAGEGQPLDCTRQDLTGVDTGAPNFLTPSLVPMFSETHAGEDVAIFASGPGANLFSGVMEQNEIFHVMGRVTGLVTPSADLSSAD